MKDIDEVDIQILNYLREKGRERVTTIADDLGINRVTAAERIEKLVKNQTIDRFTVKLNYEKLGIDVLAYVFISFKKNNEITQEELSERISKIDGVEEVHIIAGEFDILVKVRSRNLKELGDKVITKIRGFPGVENTFSHLVFQTVKE
ncbi:MAG: Lrp/AsnC family transcriptional regulator [Candidatus Thermoplasmatota archaeon]|jgi:DNA-binding Lrp family transcriptional regulator|nr:Lrp/AsnC family transcriptional regulator [Candidatus Thermoplasmatota archaeon]MCL5680754.1 Lrp/AsnC family transcriptional regulator [Candidatus Thermoplasmatota archaeon]